MLENLYQQNLFGRSNVPITPPRQVFRQYLEGAQIAYPISVFDPVSARIASHLGVELGILGGSIASATVLAAPDIIVLTLSELADQVRRICRSANVSLMVDADHGYGNALNVMRTVTELEDAGASAIGIEDTILPTAFGEGAPGLISTNEMLGKLRGAIASRKDPSLVIVARTSALQYSTLDDAVNRAREYSNVGADALMIVGASQRVQIEAIRSATHLPFVLGSAGGELTDNSFLEARGVRIIIRGHQPFFVAIQALYQAMKHISDGGSPSDLGSLSASPDLRSIIFNCAEYSRYQQEFLE